MEQVKTQIIQNIRLAKRHISPTKTTVNQKLLEKIKKNSSLEIVDIVKMANGELSNVLAELKTNPSSNYETSLRNYGIIRLTTMLESTLKKTFILLIDRFDFDYDFEITLDVKYLKILRKSETKYTNGEIIANSLNFQNLDNVYEVMDNVLGAKLWKKMVTINKKIIPINTSLKDMIDERHSIVHEYAQTSYSYKMFTVMFKNVINYLEIYLHAVRELRDKKIKARK